MSKMVITLNNKINKIEIINNCLLFEGKIIHNESLNYFIKNKLNINIDKKIIVEYIKLNLEKIDNLIDTTAILKLNDSGLLYEYGINLYKKDNQQHLELKLIADRLFLNNQAMLLAKYASIVSVLDHTEIEQYLLFLEKEDAIMYYMVNSTYADTQKMIDHITNSSSNHPKNIEIKSLKLK